MTQDGSNLATVCVLCSHNCGLRVDVQDGRIVAIRGDDDLVGISAILEVPDRFTEGRGYAAGFVVCR